MSILSTNCNDGEVSGSSTSLLFFFLLLVIFFSNCETFACMGDSLLFFFLLLVIIFANCFGNESNENCV